jgi:hypothetical protein
MIGNGALGTQPVAVVQALPISQGGDGGRVNTGDLAITRTSIISSSTSAIASTAGGSATPVTTGGGATGSSTTSTVRSGEMRSSVVAKTTALVSIGLMGIILLF